MNLTLIQLSINFNWSSSSSQNELLDSVKISSDSISKTSLNQLTTFHRCKQSLVASTNNIKGTEFLATNIEFLNSFQLSIKTTPLTKFLNKILISNTNIE